MWSLFVSTPEPSVGQARSFKNKKSHLLIYRFSIQIPSHQKDRFTRSSYFPSPSPRMLALCPERQKVGSSFGAPDSKVSSAHYSDADMIRTGRPINCPMCIKPVGRTIRNFPHLLAGRIPNPSRHVGTACRVQSFLVRGFGGCRGAADGSRKTLFFGSLVTQAQASSWCFTT